MKQEVIDSKGNVMHVEMSNLRFLKRKMRVVERRWQQMKSKFYEATQSRDKFRMVEQ